MSEASAARGNDGDVGSPANTVAVDGHCPPVHFGQSLHHRESDPNATLRSPVPSSCCRKMSNTDDKNSGAIASPESRTCTTARHRLRRTIELHGYAFPLGLLGHRVERGRQNRPEAQRFQVQNHFALGGSCELKEVLVLPEKRISQHLQ